MDENTETGMGDIDFKQLVNNVRKQVKDVAKGVNEMIAFEKKDQEGGEDIKDRDQGEVIANLCLTYRHLEDASMRLGKVLQAHDGGVSVYDKETTVGCDDAKEGDE